MRLLRVAFGLACLSCLSGFALLALSSPSGIPYRPSPALDAFALCQLAAGAASIGALSVAFALALRAPIDVRCDALRRCWQGTAATAAVLLLPGLALVL
jgi:hypothetical protein